MSRVGTAAAARSEPLIQIALLGEAIEHMPVGVFVFDETGRYAAVNSYACTLLGYTREELLERRLGDLAASPREALNAYRLVADGEQRQGLTYVRRSDGATVELHFRGSRTTIAGLTYYIGVAWEPA